MYSDIHHIQSNLKVDGITEKIQDKPGLEIWKWSDWWHKYNYCRLVTCVNCLQ